MEAIVHYSSLVLCCLRTEPGDIRLEGGTSDCSGILEVKHQDEWRPVDFSYDWNLKSSSVVCRQLDCGSAVSTQRSSGSTVQPVWKIPSSCVGQPSMRECGAKSSHNSTETLEVVCSGKIMTATMPIIFTAQPCVCVRACV